MCQDLCWVRLCCFTIGKFKISQSQSEDNFFSYPQQENLTRSVPLDFLSGKHYIQIIIIGKGQINECFQAFCVYL